MTTRLHYERLAAVLNAVRASGARSVLDLGCGDGPLLARLTEEPQVDRIIGIDLALDALQRLARRLQGYPERARSKVELHHGSLLDPRPAHAGFDAALLIETIEHIDPDRLSTLEQIVFVRLQPRTVIISTPNADLNPLLGVPGHRRRHPDHRFEWGRAKFRAWAGGVADRRGYRIAFTDIGASHPTLGGASQMAVFRSTVGPGQVRAA